MRENLNSPMACTRSGMMVFNIPLADDSAKSLFWSAGHRRALVGVLACNNIQCRLEHRVAIYYVVVF